jgi:para-nitrobenzyl esterase
VFRGVPFAAPPTGPLRFRPPRPAPRWTGARDASSFGPAAPQSQRALQLPGLEVERTSEDCLYLNVYAPERPAAPRPVLVFIHGGAFVWGAGSMPLYDGAALAQRGDVVVVTVNYRLGALGFLKLDGLGGERFGATANAGLLDQVAALRWVRRNISAFGGDASNVTVFGESAGAMSVSALLAMPAARGLFQRAILQSGTGHFVHSRRSAREIACTLLDKLGIAEGDAQKLVQVPLGELIVAQETQRDYIRWGTRGLAFLPTLDDVTLPEHPVDAVSRGAAAAHSLLVGTNRDEWKLFHFNGSEKFERAQLEARVEASLPEPDRAQRARWLIEAYRAARGAEACPLELFSAIDSDRTFRLPAIRMAEAQSRHQAGTYKYLFSWASPAFDGALGACHALELPFVFGTLGIPGLAEITGDGPVARDLSRHMMDAWVAFARSGDPSHAGLPRWQAYDSAERATLVFDATPALVRDPLGCERSAWDGIL